MNINFHLFQTGEIPLHMACANGHYEVAKTLVQAMFRGKTFQFGKLILNITNDVSNYSKLFAF